MMDELYPGYVQGGGFKVDGFAQTSAIEGSVTRPEQATQVIVGFWNFDPHCLFVRQSDRIGNPRFSFRQLTSQFVVNAIENDAEFQFSLAQKRLGEVKYVTGAGAREYGGEVSQTVISLRANGSWNKQGLEFVMRGDLAINPVHTGNPELECYNQAVSAHPPGLSRSEVA